MAVSHAIGLVMSSIILSIIWIVVYGAYAIVIKVIGLGSKKSPASYWADVSEETPDFSHQF